MFEVNLVEAVKAFSAVLPHLSKDDVTPVITSARMSATGLVGTDRYTVGSWVWESQLSDSVDTILVSREAVEWITKIDVKKLRYAHSATDYVLRVSETGDDVEVVIGFAVGRGTVEEHVKAERSQQFDIVVGNFPPVERIVDDWKAADTVLPQSIKPAFLRRVGDWVAKHEGKDAPMLIEAGWSSNEGKPGPLRVTSGQLTALIQPNLLMNRG